MQPAVDESALYRLDDGPNPSIKRPSISDIARQFAALDGTTADQLYIEGSMPSGDRFFVVVDDGTGGQVVLNVCVGDSATYLVGDEPTPDEPEYALITSGGQQTDTFTRWVVTADRAARGLFFFLATGELDPGLRWDQLATAGFDPTDPGRRLRLPRGAP